MTSDLVHQHGAEAEHMTFDAEHWGMEVNLIKVQTIMTCIKTIYIKLYSKYILFEKLIYYFISIKVDRRRGCCLWCVFLAYCILYQSRSRSGCRVLFPCLFVNNNGKYHLCSIGKSVSTCMCSPNAGMWFGGYATFDAQAACALCETAHLF